MKEYFLDSALYDKVDCSTKFVAEGDKNHIFYLKGNSLGDLVDTLNEIESHIPTRRVFEYGEASELTGDLVENAQPVYISTASEFKEFYTK